MTTFIVITAITMILVRVLIVAIIMIMLRRWVVIQSTDDDDDDDELRISGLVGLDIRSPERPPYKPILAGLLGIFNC